MINLITIEDSENDFIKSFLDNKNVFEYSSIILSKFGMIKF